MTRNPVMPISTVASTSGDPHEQRERRDVAPEPRRVLELVEEKAGGGGNVHHQNERDGFCVLKPITCCNGNTAASTMTV